MIVRIRRTEVSHATYVQVDTRIRYDRHAGRPYAKQRNPHSEADRRVVFSLRTARALVLLHIRILCIYMPM